MKIRVGDLKKLVRESIRVTYEPEWGDRASERDEKGWSEWQRDDVESDQAAINISDPRHPDYYRSTAAFRSRGRDVTGPGGRVPRDDDPITMTDADGWPSKRKPWRPSKR